MECPSTEGSGRSVVRLMPMTEVMVLMAAMPSEPASRAVRAGSVMSVMFGVILDQTGTVAFLLIQPDTSCSRGQKIGVKIWFRRNLRTLVLFSC